MDYIRLQQAVEDEINRCDLSAKIKIWINEARREIADGTIPVLVSPTQGIYRFSWSYTSANVTASGRFNDWPTNYIEDIAIFNGSTGKKLEKADPVYFSHYANMAISEPGTPSYYVNRGTTYELYPYPSDDTELILHYYSYPNQLESYEDEYEVDKQLAPLIASACALKAAYYLHDTELISIYKQKTQEYYVAAINSDKRKRFGARMIKMKTYMDYDIDKWKRIYNIGDYS